MFKRLNIGKILSIRKFNTSIAYNKSVDSNLQLQMKSIFAMTKSINIKSTPIEKPLVWIDCEMTGLDIYKDNIIEICCLITDGDLNLVDEEGYESTIYYDSTIMNNMNEWCIDQHGKSGLTEKVLNNPGQTLEKVQKDLLNYIMKYIPKNRVGIMAGNSIHMDKFFMCREFPQVIDHLHYRLLDVSAIMEMGYRHNPDLMKVAPQKAGSHTARSDIIDSINQLKWYREHYLKGPLETRNYVIEERKKIELNQELDKDH